MDTKIAIFKGKEIRKTIYKNEWWFVIEDVVWVLTDSKDPKQYIQRMKQRNPELKKGWVQIVHTLEIITQGGKQKMLCANTEGIFRIIQSIPSPKAEPFKRWLAKVGYERVQEIEDSELLLSVKSQTSLGEGIFRNIKIHFNCHSHDHSFVIPAKAHLSFPRKWESK